MQVAVLAKPGWILERLARETVEAFPAGVAAYNPGGWPPATPLAAELAYVLPMMDARYVEDFRGRLVGFFSHGEERTREMLAARKWAACVVMNRRMEATLQGMKAPNVTLVRPGVDHTGRRPRFGVCGHFHNRRRKGVGLIRRAVRNGYDFRACGNPAESELLPCEITHRTGDRKAFYASIDYLVVTSVEEGGPMTVPEAIAHGVPVIAPDVGWAWEFPVIRYAVGDWNSLKGVLAGLTRPPTWEAWRVAHRALFEGLLA